MWIFFISLLMLLSSRSNFFILLFSITFYFPNSKSSFSNSYYYIFSLLSFLIFVFKFLKLFILEVFKCSFVYLLPFLYNNGYIKFLNKDFFPSSEPSKGYYVYFIFLYIDLRLFFFN
jgi:hypothetical protein